jgi:ABC-type branched-subunit amino acid transport system substrate-binding protein
MSATKYVPAYVPALSRRRLILRILGVGLALGLVAASSAFAVRVVRTCADGVVHGGPRNECVGITDGSYVFAEHLRPVEKAIADENKWVLDRKRQFVSIVYMFPITVDDEALSPPDSVRHEIDGAYLAQYVANHDAGAGTSPLIRLLLANTDDGSLAWRSVVDRIIKREETEHIVAVAGLGESLDTTQEAIRALAAAGIPMVGSTITADDLKDIPGLFRVSPTNSDEVAAALAYARKYHARNPTALLVADTNPGDRYVQTLADAFTRKVKGAGFTVTGQTEQYDSARSGIPTRFEQVAQTICGEKPDLVYFAGRGRDLRQLVGALAGRRCPKQEVHVLTGDDASSFLDPASSRQLSDELANALDNDNITVEYTALAHPDAWKGANKHYFNSSVVEKFTAPGELFRRMFPTESLDDGQAIVSYDAVSIAVRAARSVKGQGNDEVQPDEVGQQLKGLHGNESVQGASGCIWLANDGTPKDKVIPIVQITENRIKFKDLASASPAHPTECGG